MEGGWREGWRERERGMERGWREDGERLAGCCCDRTVWVSERGDVRGEREREKEEHPPLSKLASIKTLTVCFQAPPNGPCHDGNDLLLP